MNKLECILKITPRSLLKLLPSGRCKWVQFAITWLYVKNIYISIEWKLHSRKVAVWRFERHFRHTHAHYFHLSAKPKLCDTIHFTRTRWHQNLGERQGGLKHIIEMRVSFASLYLQQPLWNQWLHCHSVVAGELQWQFWGRCCSPVPGSLLSPVGPRAAQGITSWPCCHGRH